MRPKYAGKDVASPIAAIATAQMMFEFLADDGPRSASWPAAKRDGFRKAAARLEAVIVDAIRKGKTTKDLGGELGCKATGDWIAAAIKG